MQLKRLVALAFASNVAAQSLTDALASQNSSLSTLNGLLQTQPQLVSALANAKNVTILAPSNDALSALLNNTAMATTLASNPGMLTALLDYHVLNGTYYASNFTNTSMFIPTYLNNMTYSNVTGGQRVEAMLMGGNVTFFSGLKENSTVVTANVNFTGGTIHVINSVLTMPLNDSATLVAANLTALAGALTQANLVQTVSTSKDLTIFAPSNDAFNAIANLASNLTMAQLTAILEYHVIAGAVDYSTMITNTSMMTLGGQNVTFTVENGTVFVNSAKVIEADVLVNNGVVHVIDNVLNPMNTTATPNPSMSTQAPAFSGASSASSGIPFTSGVPTPSSTVPAATGAHSSSSTGVAVPMRTGAIGAAALFGGAVMFANL